MTYQHLLWQNIVFDPELRPYIQLDPGIITTLSREAMAHPDPKQYLVDAVHRRAKARREVLDQVKEEQKMFDRAFLENTAEWPLSDSCPVKMQFWQKRTVGSTGQRNMVAFMMRLEDPRWHAQDDRDYHPT